MHMVTYHFNTMQLLSRRKCNHESLVLDPIKLRRQNSLNIICRTIDPVSE